MDEPIRDEGVDPRRARWIVTLTLAAVAMFAMAGIGTIALTRASAADAAGESAPIGSDPPTAEQLRIAEIEFQENMASGWMPYEDDAPFAGSPVKGWMPIFSDSSQLLAMYQKVEGRLPIHSERGGGQLLGYSYQYLGYVSVDVADGGSFDGHAERVKRIGCDPILADGSVDTVCNGRAMAIAINGN